MIWGSLLRLALVRLSTLLLLQLLVQRSSCRDVDAERTPEGTPFNNNNNNYHQKSGPKQLKIPPVNAIDEMRENLTKLLKYVPPELSNLVGDIDQQGDSEGENNDNKKRATKSKSFTEEAGELNFNQKLSNRIIVTTEDFKQEKKSLETNLRGSIISTDSSSSNNNNNISGNNPFSNVMNNRTNKTMKHISSDNASLESYRNDMKLRNLTNERLFGRILMENASDFYNHSNSAHNNRYDEINSSYTIHKKGMQKPIDFINKTRNANKYSPIINATLKKYDKVTMKKYVAKYNEDVVSVALSTSSGNIKSLLNDFIKRLPISSNVSPQSEMAALNPSNFPLSNMPLPSSSLSQLPQTVINAPIYMNIFYGSKPDNFSVTGLSPQCFSTTVGASCKIAGRNCSEDNPFFRRVYHHPEDEDSLVKPIKPDPSTTLEAITPGKVMDVIHREGMNTTHTSGDSSQEEVTTPTDTITEAESTITTEAAIKSSEVNANPTQNCIPQVQVVVAVNQQTPEEGVPQSSIEMTALPTVTGSNGDGRSTPTPQPEPKVTAPNNNSGGNSSGAELCTESKTPHRSSTDDCLVTESDSTGTNTQSLNVNVSVSSKTLSVSGTPEPIVSSATSLETSVSVSVASSSPDTSASVATNTSPSLAGPSDVSAPSVPDAAGNNTMPVSNDIKTQNVSLNELNKFPSDLISNANYSNNLNLTNFNDAIDNVLVDSEAIIKSVLLKNGNSTDSLIVDNDDNSNNLIKNLPKLNESQRNYENMNLRHTNMNKNINGSNHKPLNSTVISYSKEDSKELNIAAPQNNNTFSDENHTLSNAHNSRNHTYHKISKSKTKYSISTATTSIQIIERITKFQVNLRKNVNANSESTIYSKQEFSSHNTLINVSNEEVGDNINNSLHNISSKLNKTKIIAFKLDKHDHFGDDKNNSEAYQQKNNDDEIGGENIMTDEPIGNSRESHFSSDRKNNKSSIQRAREDNVFSEYMVKPDTSENATSKESGNVNKHEIDPIIGKNNTKVDSNLINKTAATEHDEHAKDLSELEQHLKYYQTNGSNDTKENHKTEPNFVPVDELHQTMPLESENLVQNKTPNNNSKSLEGFGYYEPKNVANNLNSTAKSVPSDFITNIEKNNSKSGINDFKIHGTIQKPISLETKNPIPKQKMVIDSPNRNSSAHNTISHVSPVFINGQKNHTIKELLPTGIVEVKNSGINNSNSENTTENIESNALQDFFPSSKLVNNNTSNGILSFDSSNGPNNSSKNDNSIERFSNKSVVPPVSTKLALDKSSIKHVSFPSTAEVHWKGRGDMPQTHVDKEGRWVTDEDNVLDVTKNDASENHKPVSNSFIETTPTSNPANNVYVQVDDGKNMTEKNKGLISHSTTPSSDSDYKDDDNTDNLLKFHEVSPTLSNLNKFPSSPVDGGGNEMKLSTTLTPHIDNSSSVLQTESFTTTTTDDLAEDLIKKMINSIENNKTDQVVFTSPDSKMVTKVITIELPVPFSSSKYKYKDKYDKITNKSNVLLKNNKTLSLQSLNADNSNCVEHTSSSILKDKGGGNKNYNGYLKTKKGQLLRKDKSNVKKFNKINN